MKVNNFISSASVVQSRKNENPSFGHTFRVSICTKDMNGVYKYVNPADNMALYKKLNKKIIGFLNEGFISNLRNVVGLERQTVKNKSQNEIRLQQNITQQLAAIDSDYKQAQFTRSVYLFKELGYIVTGVDVPIIEDFLGMANIGIAKYTTRQGYPDFLGSSVKSVIQDSRQATQGYVKNPAHILRSPNNNEIILRVNFREIGEKNNQPKYEADSFEFQELKTKQLLPLTPKDKSLKKCLDLTWFVKKYIEHRFKEIYNKADLTIQQMVGVQNKYYSFMSQILNIKHDLPTV